MPRAGRFAHPPARARFNGVHLLDAEAYRAAIAKVFQAVGDKLVVQITSEAIGRYGVDEQKAVILETNPEAVSLALREFAPDAASEPAFAQFLGKLKVMRIWPQFILYAPDEAKRLAAMQANGLIPFDRLAVLFVLGRYSLLKAAAPVDLLPYLSIEWPRAPFWSVCAFGRREAACATAGALLGGHVRVGFENNFMLPSGERAESNAELVDVVASAVAWLGLATQSAEGLREEIAATMA